MLYLTFLVNFFSYWSGPYFGKLSSFRFSDCWIFTKGMSGTKVWFDLSCNFLVQTWCAVEGEILRDRWEMRHWRSNHVHTPTETFTYLWAMYKSYGLKASLWGVMPATYRMRLRDVFSTGSLIFPLEKPTDTWSKAKCQTKELKPLKC